MGSQRKRELIALPQEVSDHLLPADTNHFLPVIPFLALIVRTRSEQGSDCVPVPTGHDSYTGVMLQKALIYRVL